MNSRTYVAFDYVVVKNNFNAGESFTVDPVVESVFSVTQMFPYVWLYTKGSDTLINVDTQEQITRVPGDCTISKPYPLGTWRSTLPEDLEVWCISLFLNVSKTPPLPNVSVFSLKDKQQTVVAHGTKLFLASGQISVSGKTILSGRQVIFSSGDKTVVAAGDVYGFIFP